MIQIQNIHKTFGSNHVLKGVDITIEKGEVLYIIGKSGSGKSVMLKHICALLYPDKGNIFIEGINIFEQDQATLRSVRRKMGVLFQMAALFDSMSVYENVAFNLRRFTDMSESNIKKEVAEKLELVGLKDVEHLNPSALSGGMQKRVGLARAIALDPKIMLYDEPTTAVDPILGATVDDLILRLNKEKGITSVVISHDMNSVFRTAQRVAMLYEGKFIQIGTPADFRTSTDPVVNQFVEGRSNGPIPIL